MNQVLVLRFREAQHVIREPGLYMKMPLLEDVVWLDKRVLDLSPSGQQVTFAQQKRLDVDAFARWRITDPLAFYRTLGIEERALNQLGTIVNSSVRRVLGGQKMEDVLSERRAGIMEAIRQQATQEASRFGIEIVDVRIRRADLPDDATKAVLARMRSERQQEAALTRASGEEEAQKRRANADRERTVILSQAQKDAVVIRGTAEAEALRIVAEATNRDPQFYAFHRSLQAYREALTPGTTTLLLSPRASSFAFSRTRRESFKHSSAKA